MTVIRPNSISGINSITGQGGDVTIFRADGTAGDLVVNNVTTGIVTATTFVGNVTGSGANLTSIPAAQLTGTVADARLTSVTASKLSGALPAIDGSALTGVGASFGNSSVNTSGIITATAFVSDTPLSHRNKVHNGSMIISQRYGTTAYTSPNSSKNYTIDRWAYWSNQASKASVQQVTDAPVGFYNSAKCTSLAATTAGNGDWFGYLTAIEGQDIYDLAQGTANAKSFTLSFYVKSSVTGTWAGAIRAKAGSPSRSYPFNYTISSANTWERKSITISGSTDGTWATGNSEGMNIWFDLGTGSSFHQTANQWYSGNATGPSASPFIAVNGATWLVTGVQLESGSVTTPFEHRSYAEELALCYRYYQVIAEGQDAIIGQAWTTNANFYSVIDLPVIMRATPSMEVSNWTDAFRAYGPSGGVNVSTLALNGETRNNRILINQTGQPGTGAVLRVYGANCGEYGKLAFKSEV